MTTSSWTALATRRILRLPQGKNEISGRQSLPYKTEAQEVTQEHNRGQRFPALDQLFCDYFARNRGPGYAISVSDAVQNLSQIWVSFTFMAGRTYCCAEALCHVPRDLSRLRRLASDRGITLPPSLRVHWHCIIEAGALLEYDGTPRESERYEYDEISPHGNLG